VGDGSCPLGHKRGSAGSACRPEKLAAIAAAGLFALGTLDAIGLASYTNLRIASAAWSSVNATGLAIALLITAIYVLVWTLAEHAEIGLYIGLWLMVMGVLIGLDAARVAQAEAYLLPVAVYFGFVGILWSSRKEGRPVPVGTDLAVLMLGPVAALIIALGSADAETILLHGFWAMGLSIITVIAGLFLRARILVFGGIAVLAIDALWIGRYLLVGLPDCWELLSSSWASRASSTPRAARSASSWAAQGTDSPPGASRGTAAPSGQVPLVAPRAVHDRRPQ
jgi:hypothetical protein